MSYKKTTIINTFQPIDPDDVQIINYYVVGISNSPQFRLNDELKKIISEHTVFSGGKRHYEIVKNELPENHKWIEISGNMTSLFVKYKEQKDSSLVVFASGDPLFYGFANTIQKFHPEANIKVYSTFNSLQILCQKNNIPYQKIVNTSVHGRAWDELDQALIRQEDLIGVLTDDLKNPAVIAQRMLEYNFDNYTMIVGESLDGMNEKITSLTLEEAINKSFNPLNCILLIKQKWKQKQFGIPDIEFIGLENRPAMITKMPIRLVTLSQLDLVNKKTFWDIGFCTGSIAIEAKKQFPHLTIWAFEIREECDKLFDINTKKHSVPGIQKIMGDVFEKDWSTFEAPDSVFIGGHGNQLEKLILRIDEVIQPKGRIVLNAVKKESQDKFISVLSQLNYTLFEPINIQLNEFNSIIILTAKKMC